MGEKAYNGPKKCREPKKHGGKQEDQKIYEGQNETKQKTGGHTNEDTRIGHARGDMSRGGRAGKANEFISTFSSETTRASERTSEGAFRAIRFTARLLYTAALFHLSGDLTRFTRP